MQSQYFNRLIILGLFTLTLFWSNAFCAPLQLGLPVSQLQANYPSLYIAKPDDTSEAVIALYVADSSKWQQLAMPSCQNIVVGAEYKLNVDNNSIAYISCSNVSRITTANGTIKMSPTIMVEPIIDRATDVNQIINTFYKQNIILNTSQIWGVNKIYSANDVKMSYSLGDILYIKNNGSYTTGDILYVYGEKQNLKDPNFFNACGYIWFNSCGYNFNLVGVVKVVGIQSSMVELSVISSTGAICIGDLVFNQDPDAGVVDLVIHYPTDKIEAVSLVSDNMDILIGQYASLFINSGSNNGVEAGDMFGIYEDFVGDDYYKRIGDFVVYKVYPKFSLGVVTFATKDIVSENVRFISRTAND